MDIFFLAKKSGFWIFLGVFLLYFLPWQGWFEAGDGPIQTRLALDLLRTAIGLALFLMPGGFLYLLLAPRPRVYSWAAVGFSLSYLIVALLGFFGRVVHLPFDFVRYGFIAFGGVSGLTFFLLRRQENGMEQGPDRHEYLLSAFLLVPVICCVLAGIRPTFTFNNGDDLTYLAYLTRWQHAEALGFQEIFYGTQNLEPARFWVSMIPMGWALLAELTGLHGLLLLGGYLQIFLPVVSLLSLYELARALKFAPRAALLAVFAQAIFYAVLFNPNLQTGVIFFNNLDQDKAVAAFVLAPVFFLTAVDRLQKHTMPGSWLFFLTGSSLSLAHPIILVYALIILGAYYLLDALSRKNYRQAGVMMIISLVLLSPHVYLRFTSHESESARSYTLEEARDEEGLSESVRDIEGTPFYGFNPGVLEIRKILDWNFRVNPFFHWTIPVLAVLVAGVSIFRFREPAARFVLASLFLVGLAAIPYTGWLLGYFVTPRMLWRASWFLPFGLGLAFLIEQIFGALAGRQRNRLLGSMPAAAVFPFFLSICSLVLVLVTVPGRLTLFEMYKEEQIRIIQLAYIGQMVDRSLTGSAIGAGPEPYNSTLPGLAARINVMLFRGNSGVTMNYFLGEKERLIRRRALRDLFSAEAAISSKIGIIQAYEIEYVLYTADDEDDFALRLRYPACFNPLAETTDFAVYRVNAGCLR